MGAGVYVEITKFLALFRIFCAKTRRLFVGKDWNLELEDGKEERKTILLSLLLKNVYSFSLKRKKNCVELVAYVGIVIRWSG